MNNTFHQEKIRGQRGRIRALVGICRFHTSYFNFRRKRTSVAPDVRVVSHCESSLKKNHFPSFRKSFSSTKLISSVRHFIAFAQNITSRLALMRTSRKTDFRSRKITLVELTYPKAWNWSHPLCTLIFS